MRATMMAALLSSSLPPSVGISAAVGTLTLGLLAASIPSVAQAQIGTGVISGKITDLDGKVLPYANVVLVGTNWGAMSSEDGSFTITKLPPGTYTVTCMILGYESTTVEAVTVGDSAPATVNFKLKDKPVGTLAEIEVAAAREVIKKKKTETSHTISSKDLESLPVNEISEAIGLKAGVIAKGGEIHFRGGRAGEVQYQVDGVAVRDPLVGGGVSLAALAVENTETILGGLDAQYGNAQSGVINYKTKEGGDEFEGEIYYQTDDYGQPDNTFDNLDRVFLGFGGPSPIKNLTYYVSGEGTYQDNYPATPERRTRSRILNFISIGDRKSNAVRLQSKLAFRPAANYKLTAELIRNRSRRDEYYHEWSRVGYVQTFRDTTQQGEVVVRRGRWSPTQIDETYEYYNAAEHTPNFIDHTDVFKMAWSHTLNENTFYTFKVSRNAFFADRRVQGKEPWEYEGVRERDYWFNYFDGESEDFFVLAGDYPTLSTRETKAYSGKLDFTRRWKKHTFQTGAEVTYNDMRFFQVDRPYQSNGNGEIGASRTRYHYYNPEGAAYLQDRWEHEGMVLNIGLRYDAFSVGDQLPISEVRERVKQQISPRVGIAYPISDRDVFSFHYGRFYQIPDRRYLFDDRNVFDGRTRGNPNLTNETTVSYQAGIQHLFNELIFGQFSVYYKDIFGLITTEDRPAFGSVGNLTSYVNKDYASARGFEATLTRKFQNNFAGELNYGFGVASGVASDPNALTEQTFAYLPISEQPLDWDVRHTFRVQASLAEPGIWGASFIWQYESGFPYTPYGRNTRELQPENINSRRLPSTTSLDIQAEKYYRLWGQNFKAFMQSRNVLDAKNLTDLEPGNWPLPPGRGDQDYAIYYTETGRGGGAYVGDDNDEDGIGDWVALQDPRVFGDPRSIRMGISFSF
ncbi:MAG: TonB-dependent receptor [Candidatus Eisenbacteria bacterium]|nr:TonB-dependent receptor [Candidatus Eisenbacteria bacterium]